MFRLKSLIIRNWFSLKVETGLFFFSEISILWLETIGIFIVSHTHKHLVLILLHFPKKYQLSCKSYHISRIEWVFFCYLYITKVKKTFVLLTVIRFIKMCIFTFIGTSGCLYLGQLTELPWQTVSHFASKIVKTNNQETFMIQLWKKL